MNLNLKNKKASVCTLYHPCNTDRILRVTKNPGKNRRNLKPDDNLGNRNANNCMGGTRGLLSSFHKTFISRMTKQ